jgi:hypothetical protein
LSDTSSDSQAQGLPDAASQSTSAVVFPRLDVRDEGGQWLRLLMMICW